MHQNFKQRASVEVHVDTATSGFRLRVDGPAVERLFQSSSSLVCLVRKLGVLASDANVPLDFESPCTWAYDPTG